MIVQIGKSDLDSQYKNLAFDYVDYCKWLDDELSNNNYFGISTSNIEIRGNHEWNKNGREIFDSQRLANHATQIIKIINKFDLGEFLIQHSYMPSIWFPTFFKDGKSTSEKKDFFQNKIKGIKLESFDGGFKCSNLMSSFLRLYIDYPYKYKYKNIDCISFKKDLIVGITHHLNLDFISSDSDFIEKIEKAIKSMNLEYKLYGH